MLKSPRSTGGVWKEPTNGRIRIIWKESDNMEGIEKYGRKRKIWKETKNM
jgi:hypothetical protein